MSPEFFFLILYEVGKYLYIVSSVQVLAFAKTSNPSSLSPYLSQGNSDEKKGIYLHFHMCFDKSFHVLQ